MLCLWGEETIALLCKAAIVCSIFYFLFICKLPITTSQVPLPYLRLLDNFSYALYLVSILLVVYLSLFDHFYLLEYCTI